MTTIPEIVIFDIGGVLIRILRSPEEALGAVGFTASRAVQLTDVGAYNQLNAQYQAGQVSLEFFLAQTANLLEPQVHADILLAAHDEILVNEYAGALSVVEDLHRLGVRTGVLSNTCARHWTRLSKFPSVNKAQSGGCFLSFEMGLVKPDASIYQQVQNELGIAPAHIGFLDDSEPNVVAARSLGWNAVVIEHERDGAELLRAGVHALGLTF